MRTVLLERDQAEQIFEALKDLRKLGDLHEAMAEEAAYVLQEAVSAYPVNLEPNLLRLDFFDAVTIHVALGELWRLAGKSPQHTYPIIDVFYAAMCASPLDKEKQVIDGEGLECHSKLVSAGNRLLQAQTDLPKWNGVWKNPVDMAWDRFSKLVGHACIRINAVNVRPEARAPLNEEQEREQFAAFVKKNLGDVAVMDGGRYISPKINNYWLVWQEARGITKGGVQ